MTNRDSRARVALTGLVFAAAIAAGNASAQVKQLPPGEGHRASVVEATQLPRFCWSQYLDVKGPEFEIQGCGPAMNHYCWGLVELMRANKTFGNQGLRISYLQRAKGNTLYTIAGMEKYPTCWLRPHVENTRQQVESALRAYGVR